MASMRCARSRTAAAFSKVSAAEASGFAADTAALASILFKRTANRIEQVGRLRRFRAVIAGSLLRGHLHMRVRRHQIVGNRNPLDNLDALAGQGIVLHVAHGDETV